MIKEEREERKSKRKRGNELKKKKLAFSSIPFQRWNDTIHVW